MRKLINIILMISIILSNFIPYIVVEASSCAYELVNIKSDGTFPSVSCHADYASARAAMLSHNSDESNVAGVYSNNKLIIAKYAIARLNNGSKSYVNMYKNPADASIYTYTEANFGVDAALLDYNLENNRYQIKINGFTGWVNAEHVTVHPLSNMNAQVKTESGAIGSLRMTFSDSSIRESASATSRRIRFSTAGEVFTYYEVKNTGDKAGRLWYKIKYDANTFAWVANEGNWLTLINATVVPFSLNTRYMIVRENLGSNTYYNLRHFYTYRSASNLPINFQTLGFAPKTLYGANGIPDLNKNFYSFDGVYFYNKISDMIDDYRDYEFKTNLTLASELLTSTHQKAINKSKPHFPYYLYLPTHSLTGYTGIDFDNDIKNRGYTGFPNDDRARYVKCNKDSNGLCISFLDEWTIESRSGLSLLYGQGNNLVDVAVANGINALLMYSTARNESATGTSKIAFAKNNLFGIGAVDSNPFYGAHSYATVRDSFIAFASLTGKTYSTPTNNVYHGSHYGNKNSGMNITYASDPYWGHKKAANSRALDSSLGYNDINKNTIGIKLSNVSIPVKKQPLTASETIYLMKNNNKLVSYMSMIVTEKIKDQNGVEWYKIYTDPSLDSSQNMANVPYSFSTSFGYVEAKYIYVENSAPTITAENISIREGENVNLKSGVTAFDAEDGDLTSKILISSVYDKNKVGEYIVDYSVTDSARFITRKVTKLSVLPGDAPLILADNEEITIGKPYDLLNGVRAVDYLDGTVPVTIVENNVNASVVGAYKVVYRAINSKGREALKEVTIYVVADKKPVIKATNQTISLNSSFSPTSLATAIDEEDGNLTSKIVVTVNNVKTNTPGIYKVTYSVTDSANNTSTLDIYITVENIVYSKRNGEFYFEKMNFNNTSKKLEIAGYLAIPGIHNTSAVDVKYDLIIKSNVSNVEYIKPLNRWINGAPTRKYSDGKFDYSATWFSSNVDLSDIARGEYTMYIRARSGNIESMNLFRNMFERPMSRKFSDANNAYQIRSNSYSRDYPLELFVKDSLLTSSEAVNPANMINNYKTLSFNSKFLNIIGNSFNVGVGYASGSTVEREVIFENIATGNKYVYNVGSYVGTDIPLRVSDGLSKVRGWFDTTNKIDLTQIERGRYIIYVKTKSGNFTDHGELNDIFIRNVTSTTSINSKIYSIVLNQSQRFRLELDVK